MTVMFFFGIVVGTVISWIFVVSFSYLLKVSKKSYYDRDPK